MKKLILILAVALIGCSKADVLKIEDVRITDYPTLEAQIQVRHIGSPVTLTVTFYQTEIVSNKDYKQTFIVHNDTVLLFKYDKSINNNYYIALTWTDSNGKNYKVYGK